eukprot:NODE_549_length_6847_cov_0.284084.p4 type:complete len:101 gc:universal NODE_549_length_6847_cov_0.284084:5361-5059(-)
MKHQQNPYDVSESFRTALISERERFLYLLNVPDQCTRDEEKILRPLLQIRKLQRLKCCPPVDSVSFELAAPFMDRSVGIHSERYTDEIEDLIQSGFAKPK